MSWANKTVFITGASRGIGKAIALRVAREGANVVVAAKTVTPHAKLEGTIFSACEEIVKAGGKALPIELNVMDAEAVERAMKKAVDTFGSLDVLVNNASAIALVDSANISVKQFDLMHQINSRGTFMCGRAAIPYLKESAKNGRNPSILNLSPPINLNPKWFGKSCAYTVAKYNMSLFALGWSEELKSFGVRVNCLWPRSTIATAAVKNLLGGDALVNMSRTPEIMADAAYLILNGSETGKFEIDDAVLLRAGATPDALAKYNVVPGSDLAPDFFLDNASKILSALKKGVVLPEAKL